MRKFHSSATMLAMLTVVGLLAVTASAQETQPGNPRGPRQGGGFSPQGMVDRMTSDLKTKIGASDDEWKVLLPRIQKVVVLQAQGGAGPLAGFMGMMGGMGGGRRPGNNPDGDQPRPLPSIKIGDVDVMNNDSVKALADLRSLMQNKDAPAGDVRTKLETLRKARLAAKADLAKAEKDLRDILNVNQEAQFVLMGLLD